MNYTTITPTELFNLVRKGEEVDLIDVRTPVEYREIHVSIARNIPLDQIDSSTVQKFRSDDRHPLFVICRSGNRAKQACEKLVSLGFTNVVNVEGGTTAWDQAGLPVIHGKKAISLERQVRIAAGALVVIGTAMGYFVHPYWLGLSAFIGAGLIFAGITDTCGMGLMLAKMPWNQISSSMDQKKQPPSSSPSIECTTENKTSCCG